MKELISLQRVLNVPKDQEGHKYNYRTVDGILIAVKKEAPDNVFLILSDEMVNLGDRYYTKSTATIYNGSENIACSALAREPENLPGQSTPQVSGSCSTYARKKALEGLFALNDGSDDPDDPLVNTKETVMMTPEQAKTLNRYIKDFEKSFPDKSRWLKGEIGKDLTADQAENIINRIKDFKAGANK